MVKTRHNDEAPRVKDMRFAHPDGPSAHLQVVRSTELRRRKISHSIYDPTRLDFHELQLVLKGRGAHMVDFERIELEAGCVLHIRPGQVHAFDAASDHECLLVVFLPEALARPLPLKLTHPHRPVALHPHAKDFSLLVDLAQLIEDLPSRGDRIRSKELGPPLLGAIVSATEHLVEAQHAPSQSVPSGTSGLAHGFERLLEETHGLQRSVAWHATKLGVSPRTLARACEAALGTTPKRRMDARLGLEAKRRLIFSGDSVEALSSGLGFSEPTNFVKFFRRVAGQTPQEFRRQMSRK